MCKVDCPSCDGTGEFTVPQTCLECNGEKKVTKQEAKGIKAWLDQFEEKQEKT